MTFLQKLLRRIVFTGALVVVTMTAYADTISSLPTMTVGSNQVHYYEVKRGDNLYSIAEKFGVTRHFIVSNNPSAADGVKPLMRLYFPMEGNEASSVAVTTVSTEQAIPTTHIVAKDESIYGISSRYGIPVDTLIKLNPQAASGIKPGQTLLLTEVKAPAAMADTTPTVTDDNKKSSKPKKKNRRELEDEARLLAEKQRADSLAAVREAFIADSIARAIAAQRPDPNEMEATIAVLLPFQLDENTPGRPAQLNTEFFRGMMLAAVKESKKRGAHINIRAYDTCNNADTVRSLLADPEIYTADILIAPDQAEHLALITEGAPQAQILNFLSVRDNSYLTHPNVTQANIPHDDMYTTAIKGFMSIYDGYKPVFLRRDGGPSDKDEFVTRLKSELDAAGRPYEEIVYNLNLEDDHLAELEPDNGPLVFVPNTGRLSEFSRFSDALTFLHDRSVNSDAVSLWGYPEWVAFSGDTFDRLGQLNTTIYSRFYIVPDDFEARSIANEYRNWYGIDMTDAIPSQGILGYDAATYAIRALRAMTEADTDTPVLLNFEGIQNTLRLERASDAPDAGLVNRSLFFIRYSPGGRTTKIGLK